METLTLPTFWHVWFRSARNGVRKCAGMVCGAVTPIVTHGIYPCIHAKGIKSVQSVFHEYYFRLGHFAIEFKFPFLFVRLVERHFHACPYSEPAAWLQDYEHEAGGEALVPFRRYVGG